MELTFINSLKKRLSEPLPGIEIQFEMAHVKRDKMLAEDLDSSDHKKSAVLLLICRNEKGLFIPLTERHVYKGAHSGQISLPGGKHDEKDESMEATALRECEEEIGINSGVELIGALTPIYIPVSGFLVYPFVGFLDRKEVNYIVDLNEVKQIIELPLKELMKPELVKETVVETMAGLKFKTPYFDVQGKIVWGATAMILNEFKHLLLKEPTYVY